MTTLANVVEQYIPKAMQNVLDYTGARGWVYIGNMILRQLEAKKLFTLNQVKEVGVEVSNYHWISLPSDFRSVIDIKLPISADGESDPDDEDIKFGWAFSNGKIKLDRPYDKDAAPSSFTLSTWATTGVKINDTDATADQWNDYLLVPTNGDQLGLNYIIADSAAVSAGTAQLTFLHANGPATSTTIAGYLTLSYLVLKYLAKHTGLSASTSTIPIDDKYLNALIFGMLWLATPKSDQKKIDYERDYLNEIDILECEQFTPTADQARPPARSMPGLENVRMLDTFPDYPEEGYV
jgi:hypothetical protein